MRPVYTSPRHKNIELVVALFAEHGIETTVSNRRVYDRPNYTRFSYGASEDRSRWPQVEVKRAADLTRARQLLREAGIEPMVRYAEVLDQERRVQSGAVKRRSTVSRTRTLVMLAVAVALIMLVLKYTGIIK